MLVDRKGYSNMADKVKEVNAFNQQKSKYIGLGHPDISREEFLTNIKRDTYSSLAQHDNLLYYNSVALNEPVQTLRQKMIRKMVEPVRKESPEE